MIVPISARDLELATRINSAIHAAGNAQVLAFVRALGLAALSDRKMLDAYLDAGVVAFGC